MLVLALFRGDDAALAVGLDLELFEPRRRAWAETEGDDHGVGRDDLFGTRDRLGAATATGVRLAETGLDHFHAFHTVLTHNGDRLAVVEEFHAFFLGVLHLFADHAIIPVMLGDATLAQEFANALLKEGIYVTGFFYPVVPKGQARIRTQMSADHTPEQVERAVEAFIRIGKQLNVIA